MFAITGITGRVGGIVARTLLTAKEPVRAVVRDAGKGAPWLERGCELALAEMNDAAALTAAFEAADGVFVLPPPIFDPEPGFPEARATVNAVRSALEATHPSKVVCISTIGAQATRPNLLTQLRLSEPERYRGRILQNSWPSSPHRSCPSRILGGSIQVAGHEEPGTTRPDARWLQRRLDRL